MIDAAQIVFLILFAVWLLLAIVSIAALMIRRSDKPQRTWNDDDADDGIPPW